MPPNAGLGSYAPSDNTSLYDAVQVGFLGGALGARFKKVYRVPGCSTEGLPLLILNTVLVASSNV
jgi:hypothetical protein